MVKSSSRNSSNDNPISNRILNGTEIEGDIRSTGDFRVDGLIRGTVELKGKLVVGEKAIVEGDVICSNANIAGKVKGKVTVTELLSLQSTCKVEGDIQTARLSVEPGAEFTGSCNMGVVRDMKNEAEDEEEKGRRSAG
jgi:cytoskeletal protein CcmA (bactofilin family)